MFYRFWLYIKSPEKTLWVQPALGALFAIVFATLGFVAKYFLPLDLLPNIDATTLDDLLDIIATSMLAVSTFSLSIMVAAFASASNNATPRASKLVMADKDTRMAIASFISSFIYAAVAKTATGLGYYDQNGRFVLFAATILILLYLITTLIRWVHTLSLLGRLSTTIDKIRVAALNALKDYRQDYYYGACASPPKGAVKTRICGHKVGYLTHIDFKQLQELAQEYEVHFHIQHRPGKLLYGGECLVEVYGQDLDNERQQKVLEAFILGRMRTYEQDVRFGLIVLSEVAQRALSPSVNDPGTAIQILAVIAELLIEPEKNEEQSPRYANLSMVALEEADLIAHPIAPIARDGADNIEVGVCLQKVLAGIYQRGYEKGVRAEAKHQAKRALELAQKALILQEDYQILEKLHRQLFDKSERT